MSSYFLLLFFLPLQSYAQTPYCNIAEIIDGMPAPTANVAEFKHSEVLKIKTKDSAAEGRVFWNAGINGYQVTLKFGALQAITLAELPTKSAFVNLQDGKRTFQTQCRFEF